MPGTLSTRRSSSTVTNTRSVLPGGSDVAVYSIAPNHRVTVTRNPAGDALILDYVRPDTQLVTVPLPYSTLKAATSPDKAVTRELDMDVALVQSAVGTLLNAGLPQDPLGKGFHNAQLSIFRDGFMADTGDEIIVPLNIN